MAYISPRMSLKVWNSTSDPYSHEQLADNFIKLDLHDHSSGRGVQIGGDGIRDGAITNEHIVPGSLDLEAFNLEPGEVFLPIGQEVCVLQLTDSVALTPAGAANWHKLGDGTYGTWNEVYDPLAMHEPTGATKSRITLTSPGIWQFEYAIALKSGSGVPATIPAGAYPGGLVRQRISKNGVASMIGNQDNTVRTTVADNWRLFPSPLVRTYHVPPVDFEAVPSYYVEAEIYMDTGTLHLTQYDGSATIFSATKIADLSS